MSLLNKLILAWVILGGAAVGTAHGTLEVRKIKVADQVVAVEIADTDESRARGLMFRKSLADNKGMLFVFPTEQVLAFWMKNTLIPLSIGYFDRGQVLIDVQEMAPESIMSQKFKTYPSSGPAKFALEMPKGWFSAKKIKPGARFDFIGARPDLGKSANN